MTHNTLERVSNIVFWGNRFAEHLEHPDRIGPSEADVLQIADDLYPQEEAAEMAHVAEVNGRLGILIEWEYADYVRPDPAFVAHWRMMAPDGVIYDCYAGNEARPTFDDCWVCAIFIPLDVARAKGRKFVDEQGNILVRRAA